MIVARSCKAYLPFTLRKESQVVKASNMVEMSIIVVTNWKASQAFLVRRNNRVRVKSFLLFQNFFFVLKIGESVLTLEKRFHFQNAKVNRARFELSAPTIKN